MERPEINIEIGSSGGLFVKEEDAVNGFWQANEVSRILTEHAKYGYVYHIIVTQVWNGFNIVWFPVDPDA